MRCFNEQFWCCIYFDNREYERKMQLKALTEFLVDESVKNIVMVRYWTIISTLTSPVFNPISKKKRLVFPFPTSGGHISLFHLILQYVDEELYDYSQMPYKRAPFENMTRQEFLSYHSNKNFDFTPLKDKDLFSKQEVVTNSKRSQKRNQRLNSKQFK